MTRNGSCSKSWTRGRAHTSESPQKTAAWLTSSIFDCSRRHERHSGRVNRHTDRQKLPKNMSSSVLEHARTMPRGFRWGKSNMTRHDIKITMYIWTLSPLEHIQVCTNGKKEKIRREEPSAPSQRERKKVWTVESVKSSPLMKHNLLAMTGWIQWLEQFIVFVVGRSYRLSRSEVVCHRGSVQ